MKNGIGFKLAGALAMICLLTGIYLFNQPDQRVHIYFLDVGQGDAILIQQRNCQILIDGGLSPEALLLELGRIMPFWDRTVEAIILTHPHADHLTGLVEVLRRYRVERVLEPISAAAADPDYPSPLVDEWHALIDEKAIALIPADSGRMLIAGDFRIDILSPPPGRTLPAPVDAENDAVALEISCGIFNFLLTADMTVEGEHELLMGRLVHQTTVLKIGHHGSAASSSADFLRVVDPRLAVISVGVNTYGHPDPTLIAQLEEQLGAENIYRTDRDGTVEFITDGQNLWLEINARN